jgi:prevent-host-death family protein
MAAVMERVEVEGVHVIVSRQGRPVGVLVPAAHSHAWMLANRPLEADPSDDPSFWPVDEGIRVAPSAEDAVTALREQTRTRLWVRLRKLRGYDASGRVVVRAGQLFALVELNGPDVPTLLGLARRAQLQPM